MWARIIEQDGVEVVAEVISFDPAAAFTPDIAAMFVPATEGMVYMARKVGGVWVAPPEPEPAPEPEPPAPVFLKEISPVAFLMMFSPQERVAIRLLRLKSHEPVAVGQPGREEYEAALVVDDWMKIVEDPRLTVVNLNLPQAQAGLDFLATIGILTTERAAEIKAGIPQ